MYDRNWKTWRKRIFELYSKIVIQIPTHHPIIREDKEDRVYVKSDDKNKAILEQIIHIHQTKQPVLLITRTAEAAEFFLPNYLNKISRIIY